MDIKQIQYFVEVCNTGSFNAAAKRLFFSVPGLVKSMDKLEAELGVTLFVRMRSGVTLTPAGQMLARYANDYLRRHEMIVSNVRKAAEQREMCVEVCMTWGLLSFFPRDFLSRFVLDNPDVSLITHYYALKELHSALQDYYETIGLYFGEIADPDLQVLFHRESPLHALMSAEHPLSKKTSLAMSDLKKAKVILVNSDPDVMRLLQQQLESVGCAPRIMLDGSEWDQAMELIAQADYISFCLPPRNLDGKRFQTRAVDDLQLTVNFNMAVMQDAVKTDAERRFVDYVVKLMNCRR